MISLPSSVRVFLHTPPTDLRKGFDALCGLVTTAFGQDPTSGHLFLFVNRRRDRMKILYWDRDGLAIWYKKYPCEHADSFDTTACADNLFGRTGLVRSDKEVSWFCHDFHPFAEGTAPAVMTNP